MERPILIIKISFFNFVDDNNNIIPTNYIKKDNLQGFKKQHEEVSIKVKAISPHGEIYYFNSLTEMQRQIGIERHTARKVLKEQRPILSGKFKNWIIEKG